MIMDTYNFALFDAIGIPVEIKEMKNDFSFYILRIVSILLTSSFYLVNANLIKNPIHDP
jgi:hypothetical protein